MAYEHQLLVLAYRLKQLLPLVPSKLPVVLTALGQSQVSCFLSYSPSGDISLPDTHQEQDGILPGTAGLESHMTFDLNPHPFYSP